VKNKSSHIVLPDETPLGNDLALNLLTRMQKKNYQNGKNIKDFSHIKVPF